MAEQNALSSPLIYLHIIFFNIFFVIVIFFVYFVTIVFVFVEYVALDTIDALL